MEIKLHLANQHLKQKAFGIVEVMIAIGLVGIMAAGISGMLTGAMRQQAGIQAKDQQREVTAEIRNLLNNKVACLNSFGGGNVQTGFPVSQVKDASNTVRYALNTNDKSEMLTFKEFAISHWVADAGYTTQGNADFKIKLSKASDTGTVKEIKPDIITLKVKTDVSGNVIECFSMGISSDGFWQASPSNVSNIFFSGGNVGVGVNDPQSKLDVAGNIRPGSAGVATGGVCSGEGSFGYDIAAHAPVFCNSSGVWATMGGGGGLGVGQTWQDMTSLRVNNTDYVNNTGKPIMVSISQINWIFAYVDGLEVAHDQGGNQVTWTNTVFVVPAGSIYKINAASIMNWRELR